LPEGDPLADLDLGSIGSLPPVNRTGKSPGFKFGAPQLTAVLLACGAALAIIILATAFADQLFPDQANAAAGKSGSAKRTSAGGEQPLVQPAVAPVPPAVAAKHPKRVLFVIPNDGLWLADYRDVRSVLEAGGVAVEVASTSLDRCRLAVNSEVADVYADVVLDKNLTHQRYGAVVFTGMNTKAYIDNGSHAGQVQRLIGEFKSAGKPVTAICGGELVLAAHGQLDGKRAARHRHGDLAALAPQSGADWIDERVVRDGQIITAGSFDDAAEFANEVTRAIEE
jgi:protease I